MVINMKPVNHRVESPGYPMDGSSNFMSRLEQGDVCFRVFDLVQGFHQVPVNEDSRDLIGKLRPSPSSSFSWPELSLNSNSDHPPTHHPPTHPGKFISGLAAS